MGKGCLLAFLFCIAFISLVVFFTGGAVNLDALFGSALVLIIVVGIVSLFISIIKGLFGK